MWVLHSAKNVACLFFLWLQLQLFLEVEGKHISAGVSSSAAHSKLAVFESFLVVIFFLSVENFKLICLNVLFYCVQSQACRKINQLDCSYEQLQTTVEIV